MFIIKYYYYKKNLDGINWNSYKKALENKNKKIRLKIKKVLKKNSKKITKY